MPEWRSVSADFRDANSAMSNAQRGFSDAGTIFSRINEQLYQNEKLALDEAYRQRTLDEDIRQFEKTHGLNERKLDEEVRQFGLTHQLNRDKLAEDIRSHNLSHSAAMANVEVARQRLNLEKAQNDARMGLIQAQTNKLNYDQQQNFERNTLDNIIANGLSIRVEDRQQASKDITSLLNSPQISPVFRGQLERARKLVLDHNPSVAAYTPEAQQSLHLIWRNNIIGSADTSEALGKFATDKTKLVSDIEKGYKASIDKAADAGANYLANLSLYGPQKDQLTSTAQTLSRYLGEGTGVNLELFYKDMINIGRKGNEHGPGEDTVIRPKSNAFGRVDFSLANDAVRDKLIDGIRRGNYLTGKRLSSSEKEALIKRIYLSAEEEKRNQQTSWSNVGFMPQQGSYNR